MSRDWGTVFFLLMSMSEAFSIPQFSSVTQSRPTLCNPMDCSTPGLPVHHQLPEFTQTHVHWVSEAIQPSHPLLSPSPAFNLCQHQGLFQWVSSSHQVAKVLEFHNRSWNWVRKIYSFSSKISCTISEAKVNKLFCKGPDNKYFGLVCSTLPGSTKPMILNT